MAWQQPPLSQVPVYDNRQQTGGGPAPTNPFLSGPGSDILRTGISAYGEKLFGTGREYVESNINRYFHGEDVGSYFRVNDLYVKNKLKVILFPFLHRGHWTRISDQVGAGLAFRPPVYDINAPDLYIPFMAFATFLVLSGFAFGLVGKFSPEAFSFQFTKGVICWLTNVMLIQGSLYWLGNADIFLDVVSYAGYAFVGISLSILARMIWSYAYYIVMPWTSLCMAIFLVKTMKRVLFTVTRSYGRDNSKHHYWLLFVAIAQFPLSLWLGYLKSA